jgi:crotonobetainyl-CoA:carnitine CoA-transferase CaiB-like acyl-CoA transferase
MPAEGIEDGRSAGPLACLRVLELATLFAVPLMGAMLGDLGADVVKVEPPAGDALRVLGGSADRPGPWTLASRNKRMVVVDPSTTEGLDLLHALTAVADVVTTNHPRPLLERLGCTYEDIAARNKRTIVVNASTFGTAGPYADRPGNGSVAESFAGFTYLNRLADGAPALTPVLLGDHLTALTGLIGTLAACYWRDTGSGQGQHVDLSMYEAVLSVLGPQLLAEQARSDRSDGEPGSGRPGLRGAFPTGDGNWITATAYSDAQISRLLDVVGLDAGADPAAGPPDLAGVAADWMSGQDRQTVVDALSTARIAFSPVNDPAMLAADPQVQHRGSLLSVDRPSAGPLTFARPAPVLSKSPASVRWIEHPIGADHEDVLRDWLGA